jgi:hypothetical protein
MKKKKERDEKWGKGTISGGKKKVSDIQSRD